MPRGVLTVILAGGRGTRLEPLTRDRAVCAEYASHFGWDESARQFLDGLVPIRRSPVATAQAVLEKA